MPLVQGVPRLFTGAFSFGASSSARLRFGRIEGVAPGSGAGSPCFGPLPFFGFGRAVPRGSGGFGGATEEEEEEELEELVEFGF